jgi:hypothetical protein
MDLVASSDQTRSVSPEKSFDQALHALWEVDEGIRTMTPEEARLLWEDVKAHVDYYDEYKKLIEERKRLLRDRIANLSRQQDFAKRYIIRAMRSAGLEELEGETTVLKLNQTLTCAVLESDIPTVEDMANCPEAVNTATQWATPQPSKTLLNEILQVFVDHEGDIFEMKRKISALLFSPAKYAWATHKNGHKIINNLLRNNPGLIAKDRYMSTISESLTTKEKLSDGKRNKTAKRASKTKHSDRPALDGSIQGADSVGSSEASFTGADDARCLDVPSH